MIGRRRNEERRPERRRYERAEIDPSLDRRDPGEALAERQDQHEGEQDLNARERHAKLVQQFDELAIDSIVLILSVLRILSHVGFLKIEPFVQRVIPRPRRP